MKRWIYAFHKVISGSITWTLIKRLEKKLNGNYTRMLRAILNKSWRQHPTRHQLYGHLPPIMKTIQVRRTRHARHCWRSRDELISDVLLWTPTYGRAKAGWPAQTYIQQLCEDTGCSTEDLPEAMNDREKWRERVRDICASGTTWWWWWLVKVKCKQPHPGFELMLLIPFLMIIAITLSPLILGKVVKYLWKKFKHNRKDEKSLASKINSINLPELKIMILYS